MKRSYILIFLVSVAAISFVSCKKAENKLLYEGGTNPKLTASKAGPLVFLKSAASDVALTMNWTNPNYAFNTGVNSLNVNYILEMDLAGSNFANPNRAQVSMGSELLKNFTTKELNTMMNTMELKAGTAYNMEFRLKSTLGAAVPLYSNVLKITMTPYLDFAVEPPGTAANNYLDGNLWVVGDAFASGWSNPLPAPYDVSQKFTRIDVLHYELTVPFKGGGGYKMIQEQGVWGTQYHALDGSQSAALSGSFEKKDSDPQFPGPAAAGTYKIQVNFQTGKYTLTKQ